jgi:hypothetical protein
VALDRVDETIARMIELRELGVVFVDALPAGVLETTIPQIDDEPERRPPTGRQLAANAPRYVRLGRRAFICGTLDAFPLPCEAFGGDEDPSSIVRWVDATEGSLVQLEEAGLDEWELVDWIGVPGWTPHLERRGVAGSPAVHALWSALAEGFERFAMPISDPSRCAVVAGDAGGYFGRSDAYDGRWRRPADAADGVWCGVLRGYGDQHQRPVIAEVRGGSVTGVMELFDFDEFRWALVARGVATGRHEVAQMAGDQVAFTFPLPAQWQRLGALCKSEKWRWTPPPWVTASDVLGALPGVLLK